MSVIFILMFGFFNFYPDTYQHPEYIKVADAIRSEVGDRLEVRHKMTIVAEYGALFDKINELGFRFQATGPKTKEELREILIDCTEELVNAVNQTEGISQHLGSYPFTFDKVDIGIFLDDDQGYEVRHPFYGVVTISQGRLYYYTDEKGRLGAQNGRE